LVFLDVAQSIAHQSIDVRILDVDFLAFSGHKILGPTGTGIFYGKMNLLTELKPFMVGGDTVEFSTYTDYKMLPVPQKFEAGLQDYAGIIGLAEAIKFLKRIGYSFIQNQEKELNTYITNELLKIPQIKIIGPVDASLRSGIIDFYLEEMEVHQLAIMLDQMEGICIRSGQHCVHSWFQNRKIKNSARVSLYFYNTQAEAEMFISSLRKIMKIVS
jgi:cysteine desulfurase/selenocysteine lyase